MKQLLSLFLFLLPCLAWAQYPSNGNQKITLGEQTTADGLIWRGVASPDTLRKPSIDTMAYMVLDTTTNIMWHYKKATSNAWLRLNLLPSDTASMLTPYWRSGRFSGVLPVANGGTGETSYTSGNIPFSNGTLLTSDTSLYWDNTNKRLGIGTKSPNNPLSVRGRITMFGGNDAIFFSSNGVAEDKWHISVGETVPSTFFSITESGVANRIRIIAGGNVGIGTTSPGNLLTIKDKSQIGFRDEASSTTRNALQNYAYTLGYGDGLRIGEQYNAVSIGGNVGIGTTTPAVKLDVTGSVFVKDNSNSGNILVFPTIKVSNTKVSTGINDFSFSSFSFFGNNELVKGEFFADGSGYFNNGTPNVYFRVGTNHPMLFGTNNFERMRLTKDGEFTIGYGDSDNGDYLLQVNSQIFATNATIATSDIRFKENIKPLDKGLEIINKLKPVKFNFITTTENNFSEFDEIGFIAQDVEGALSTELFAKAVVKKLDEDKDDSALGLMTEKLIPILVKAIQEQNLLIKALEQRIINLENK